MNSPASIARSGMNAALLRLDAAANNIANQGTPGYRRQSVLQQAQPGGGVDTSIAQAAAPGENLAEDIVQQRIASYSFQANLRVIQTQDHMLGALLDLHA
ncbi:MAG TPA: flagellar basal body protein [Albitalea sp.]|nr:flagellar basal body protein [Albitalea sp.]